jgi:4-amino-4-deoxy-L-arabinose transferase-like glycosyltransferase
MKADTLPHRDETDSRHGSSASFSQKLAIPAIVFLHLGFTLFLSYKLNIWVDEAFSLHTTERGLSFALNQALNFELQAPLYFLLLSLWRKLDSSIFFARIFSVVCVVIAIKLVATLAQRLWKDAHPGWIVAAVAFNPLTIYVAVDIRPYALILLLTVALLLAFYDGYLAESRTRRAQICYVVIAIAALYTQYYLGFLLLANACALLVLKRWRPLLEYLIAMAIVGIGFAPMLPFIRRQMSAHTAPMQANETWLEAFAFVGWRMKDYLLPVGWDWMLVVRSWLFRLCYVATVWIVITRRRDLKPETIAIWTITATVALLFVLTARASGEKLLLIRHTTVMFLPVVLLAFSIAQLSGRKIVLVIWALLMLSFSLSFLYVRYKPMAKDGDWQRVASYLQSAEGPDQAILVFHAGAALPLARHYHGRNMLVPIPRENTFERFDFHDYVLRDEREIQAALERTPGDDRVIWLVTDGNCEFGDINYNCATLEEFVNKFYSVEETRQFHGSVVRRLRKKE